MNLFGERKSESEIETLPIIMISMSRWDGEISSASISLAKTFSNNNKVFYVDYPYTLFDFFREMKFQTVRTRISALLFGVNSIKQVEGYPENLFFCTPLLVLPMNRLREGKLYDFVTFINNKILAHHIKKILKLHKIKNFIFINSFNPFYLHNISKFLNPVISVYQSRDAIEEVPGHGLNREIQCVLNYNLSIGTSKQLCSNITKRTGKEVIYFPNGGDTKLFNLVINESFKKPEELNSINTKIIGYTGAICQRIDYNLLEEISKFHSDKTIVMIGPIRDIARNKINRDKLKNVVFLGAKKIDELPQYLKYFDCTIIPFLKNNLTSGIYPLKINEYLAAGKAIVSTDFSEDVLGFKNSIFIGKTSQEFLSLINIAIESNTKELIQERMLLASQNSWEIRIKSFWDIIKYNYK